MLIIAFKTFRIDNEWGTRRGNNIGEFCVTFRLKSTPPNSLWSHWYWRAASRELNVNYFIQFSDICLLVYCVNCASDIRCIQCSNGLLSGKRMVSSPFVHLYYPFTGPKRFFLFKLKVFCSLLLDNGTGNCVQECFFSYFSFLVHSIPICIQGQYIRKTNSQTTERTKIIYIYTYVRCVNQKRNRFSGCSKFQYVTFAHFCIHHSRFLLVNLFSFFCFQHVCVSFSQ